MVAWFWARTVPSPDPTYDGEVPLVRTWELRRKKDKPVIWVEPNVDRENQRISYEIRKGGRSAKPTMVPGGRGDAVCLVTGAPMPRKYLQEMAELGRMGQQLIAVAIDTKGGKTYLSPDHTVVKPIDRGEIDHPEVEIPVPNQKISPSKYGMKLWTDLLTDRQLLAISTFSSQLEEVHREVSHQAKLRGLDSPKEYADIVVTYLAMAISRCLDFWSTINTWIASTEAFSGTLGRRQAIQMTWDFAEANPYSSSAGSWGNMVEGIARVVENLPTVGMGKAVQAEAIDHLDELPDPVISTDPPYYDNILYAEISDYFHIWLRHNLKGIWSDLFSTIATPKEHELVADHKRHGGKDGAKGWFEQGMKRFLTIAAQKQNPFYPLTIYYSYKQTRTKAGELEVTGWETFLEGLVGSGLRITATWPLLTERSSRPVALDTRSLSYSVLVVCRPAIGDRKTIPLNEFKQELIGVLKEHITKLQSNHLNHLDVDQAMIGYGMEVFTRYEKVEAATEPLSVKDALQQIGEAIDEMHTGMITNFDPFTRWAVAWFRHRGWDEGGFGEAELAMKTRPIDTDTLVKSEMVKAEDKNIFLVPPEELDPNWDPLVAQNMSQWEVLQHLANRISRGSDKAVKLLSQILAKQQELENPVDLLEVPTLAYLMKIYVEEHASKYAGMVSDVDGGKDGETQVSYDSVKGKDEQEADGKHTGQSDDSSGEEGDTDGNEGDGQVTPAPTDDHDPPGSDGASVEQLSISDQYMNQAICYEEIYRTWGELLGRAHISPHLF